MLLKSFTRCRIDRGFRFISFPLSSNTHHRYYGNVTSIINWSTFSRKDLLTSQRFVSTSSTSSLFTFQKANPNITREHIEQKFKEKFGSKLVGWDPRTTNNGEVSVIYDGTLKSHIRSLKLFSFGTTMLGVGLQVALIDRLAGSSLIASAAVFGIVGFFTFITPFLIHLLAKRYVTEVIYDPKSDIYTAVTYSFFLQRKELNFSMQDVTVPEVPGMFTTILIKSSDGKNLPLFLADVCFHDLKHFGRLMGFDKPVDFGISASDVQAAIEAKKSSQSQSSSIKSS